MSADGKAAGEAGASRPYSATIIFLALASFSAAGTTRIMDAILPQIALEFGVTIGSVAFVATAYAFTYGASQLFFGPLGDRYGKLRVILLACIGSALTTLTCMHSETLTGIALARFASGVMAAAIVPLSIAWVGDMVAEDARQPILAQFMSGQILGLLAGQVGGGVLGDLFGWRAAFLFIAASYLFAVAGLLAQIVRQPELGALGSDRSGSFARSFRTMTSLWSRPVVRFVMLAISIEAFAMFGAFTYVGANLRFRFGLDFALVGLFLACYCLGGLAYIARSKALYARLGSRHLPFWGTVLVALSFVALALAPHVWVCAPIITVMGFGFYMLHNTLQMMATQMAQDARGSAVALFATFYFLAQSIGVFLAGQVIDRMGYGVIFATAATILLGLGWLLLRHMPDTLRLGR